MPIAPRWRLGNRACRARLLGDRLLASEQPPPVFGTDRLYRRRKERPARRSLGGGRQDRQAYDRFPPDVSMQLCRRSEEHTSELQSLMRISYAVFCLKKQKHKHPP